MPVATPLVIWLIKWETEHLALATTSIIHPPYSNATLKTKDVMLVAIQCDWYLHPAGGLLPVEI